MIKKIEFSVKTKHLKIDNHYLIKLTYDVKVGVYDYMRSTSDVFAHKIMLEKIIEFLDIKPHLGKCSRGKIEASFKDEADEAAFIMKLNALSDIEFTMDVEFSGPPRKTFTTKERAIENFFDNFDDDYDGEDEDEDE